MQVADPLVGVEVAGQHGPMKLVLNIAEGERPVSIGGDPHGEHDVLVVNGRDMAQEILVQPLSKKSRKISREAVYSFNRSHYAGHALVKIQVGTVADDREQIADLLVAGRDEEIRSSGIALGART